MNDTLARVNWEMGQPLLPEHLEAMEASGLADTIRRFRLRGLPCHGIGDLRLNAALLAEGIFSIESGTFVTGTGTLLSVPENARIRPFNLNDTGMTTVAVYLHVQKQKHVAGKKESPGGWSAEAASEVKRNYWNLVLTAERASNCAAETLKVAEVLKHPEGHWELSSAFIPPLLQVGNSPFLKEDLAALTESLELFRHNLTMDSASYLSGDSLFSVKQCLKSVFRTLRLLSSIANGVHLHPYHLHEEVQNLLADVCFYRNANPEGVTRGYVHEKPIYLRKIIGRLTDQMQLVRSKPAYVAFSLYDNLFKVALPDEIRKATDVYFLVQKKQITNRVSVDSLKMAGVSRLPFVHKMALHGVPIQRVERPPFQHTFGAEVEFYQIRESEEWDHALNERSLAFFSRPDLMGSDFYVYWRMNS